MQSQSRMRGRAFMIRLIIAAAIAQSPEEFAKEEVRNLQCSACRAGLPLEHGQHRVLGITLPCDAAADIHEEESWCPHCEAVVAPVEMIFGSAGFVPSCPFCEIAL